jgi:inosine-uridine nucleoside N-ribohydrolase
MVDEALKNEWEEFSNSTGDLVDEKTHIRLLRQLKKPVGPVDVVLDTDTYNEIDDQYALAYLIQSDEKLRLKAIYAAPFANCKCDDPADGMERSYEEIINILHLMGRKDLETMVYKGAKKFLPDEQTPVISDAARDLAERAMEYTEDNPLYVIAIAAITNIASALLINPDIRNRIVLVWLGGNALDWPNNKEFNLYQDIAGARIVFDSKAPLVQLPCMGVVSAFTVSGPELNYHLKGKNALCDYLVKVTEEEAVACGGGVTWSRPIWDVTAVGWLLDGDFMEERLEYAPIPEYDDRYAYSKNRHFYKYVYYINRDCLLEDLVKKLTR